MCDWEGIGGQESEKGRSYPQYGLLIHRKVPVIHKCVLDSRFSSSSLAHWVGQRESVDAWIDGHPNDGIMFLNINKDDDQEE